MESPFAPPDVYAAKRILAIQPHYDDNDIAAGGTLAALAQGGAEVYYLTVTDDLIGVLDEKLSPEDAAAQLKAEQYQAGEIIGVKGQYWLGYPDAGKYDYFDLRRDLIQHIRMVKPDFIFTVDPWTPYEAHQDHIITGKAAAEAAILYGLTRLKTISEVDDGYEPVDLLGIAFYATAHPNTIVDISQSYAAKHQAVQQYRAQFDEADMQNLLAYLDYQEQEYAQAQPFSHGEPLKVLRGMHLHVFPEAWKT
jgi:LmbE family N-acetylglucosaminyl deacetylase